MSTTAMLNKFSEQQARIKKLKSQLAASQTELVEMQAIIAENDRQIDEVEEILCTLLADRKVSLALAESLKKLTYTELITLLPALTKWAATGRSRNWLTSTQRN